MLVTIKITLVKLNKLNLYISTYIGIKYFTEVVSQRK